MEQLIGVLGELHPLTAEKFGIEGRAYVAEIRLETLYAAWKAQRTFYAAAAPSSRIGTRPVAAGRCRHPGCRVSKQPSVKGPARCLKSVKLFDVYQGRQVPEGKKSVSYSLTCAQPTAR